MSESLLSETDSTREATIRNVTDQMNDISLTVSGQVADRLLYVRIANPAIFVESGLLKGCTKGSIELYYGTTGEYDDAATDFRQIQLGDGWTLHPREPHLSSEKSWISMYSVDKNDRVLFYPDSCNDYPICYKIVISYADPSMAACSG
jgi:hypothetical protein